MAERKLNLILESKSMVVPPVKIGYHIQVFIKLQHEKRGKRLSAKLVIAYDRKSVS